MSSHPPQRGDLVANTGDYSAEEALARQRAQGIDRARPYEPKEIYDEFKTGNDVVDAIGTIQLQGMLIDRNWFRAKEFQTEKGAAMLVDILVYGNLVDWHRPRKSNDTTQPDGTKAKVVCWKKFPQEHFVTTYAHMAAALGMNPRQVEDAIERQVKGREVKIDGKKHRIAPTIGKRAATAQEVQIWKRTHSATDKPIVLWPIPTRLREVSKRQELALPGLKEELDTGNDIVNALWTIGLVGDVIDWNWLVHPRLRSGAKKLLNITAIFTLANIFYWHTPTEHFDEHNGQQLPSTTKFHESAYTVTYNAWAESTFLTAEQLRVSVKFLHAAGIIQRQVGAIYIKTHKATIPSVVFITLNVADMLDLTFGPFAINERGRPARRATPKVETVAKRRGKPSKNLSLFASDLSPQEAVESASGIYRPAPKDNAEGDLERESASGIYRPEPAEFTDLSQRNLPTIIETFVEDPLRDQQQQSAENESSFGGGGFDDKSSGAKETQVELATADATETPIERRARICIERLISLGTGCESATIRRAAAQNLEHAEMWATWWPRQPEAVPAFWEKRPGSTGAALAKRLRDVAQLPPQVSAQRRADEAQAQAARQQQERQAAQDFARQQQDADLRAKQQFARETFARFETLAPDVAASAVGLCETAAFEFFLKRLGVSGLAAFIEMGVAGQIADANAAFALASALDVAVDRALELAVVAATSPALVEEIEEIEDDSEPAVPSLIEHLQNGGPSAIVDELARDARDGMTLSEFEAARGDYTPAEWKAVRARVERAAGVSLGEAPAAADVAASGGDDATNRAEAERADGLWARMSDASRKMIDADARAALLREVPADGQTEDARIEFRRAFVCNHFDAPYKPKRAQSQDEEAQSA